MLAPEYDLARFSRQARYVVSSAASGVGSRLDRRHQRLHRAACCCSEAPSGAAWLNAAVCKRPASATIPAPQIVQYGLMDETVEEQANAYAKRCLLPDILAGLQLVAAEDAEDSEAWSSCLQRRQQRGRRRTRNLGSDGTAHLRRAAAPMTAGSGPALPHPHG